MMSAETDVKHKVREFYNQVGWQLVGEDIYQNAHYEDLRPVSHEYIHRCHLRVARHLQPQGRYLLDAGSGPIQYPEYLEYSRGYHYRVCADISITALQEARDRIGKHGLYVVTDVANLPFRPEAFDGFVSLHTIHHLPEDEHLQAYDELYRVLKPGKSGAVVNGWPSSRFMSWFNPLFRWINRARNLKNRLLERGTNERKLQTQKAKKGPGEDSPKGTFTNRHDVDWVNTVVGSHMAVEILVWRSVSVKFLRNMIHPFLAGRLWLRLLYWLEERYPHYFGENGQYPLIVIRKESGPSEIDA
jgi:SAM-dependent methyltransferase